MAAWAIARGLCPLFEWCPATHVIGVLRHKTTHLVLLAIRDNITGAYTDLAALAGDPQTRGVLDGVEIAQALGALSDLDVARWTEREGVVLCRPDGLRFKLKSTWYVAMAQAAKLGGAKHFLPKLLQRVPLSQAPPASVWVTALQALDDVVASTATALADAPTGSKTAGADGSADASTLFLRFVDMTRHAVERLARVFADWAADAFDLVGDAEAVATYAGERSGWPGDISRAGIRRDSSTLDRLLRAMLVDLCKRDRVSVVEEMLSVRWCPKTGGFPLDDEVLPLDFAGFDESPPAVRDHVTAAYLPRKLATLMGTAGDVVHISRTYRPDEGKIKGMWERFAKDNIVDLRVDLQPMRKEGATAHNGSPSHALLLVQYGLVGAAAKYPRGSFAGVLVPTECDVPAERIVEAMQRSFETRRMVRLRWRYTAATAAREAARGAPTVFCDLDGVLADFDRGVREATGRAPEEQPLAKMWQRILTRGGFFQGLHWTSGGERLWKDIVSVTSAAANPTAAGSSALCGLPAILSGIPFRHKKMVSREKTSWCREMMGALQPASIVTCLSADKGNHSGPGKILIDDNPGHRRTWTSHGGTFIHHVSPERTLFELRRALGQTQHQAVPPQVHPSQPMVLARSVVLVVDEWPLAVEDAVVGLDAEWQPGGTHPVALVQIATATEVFVIDMVSASRIVKERLQRMLGDRSVLKVGFALGQDCRLLGTNLVHTVDLQEVAVDTLGITGVRGTVPGMSAVVEAVLGLRMDKSKRLQVYPWEQRPLPEEQLLYAACDAAAALDCFLYLRERAVAMPPTCLLTPVKKRSTAAAESRTDLDLSAPVDFLFSGVFLSPASRAQLLARVPPAFPIARANHVTLQHSPTAVQLRGLRAGQEVTVSVSPLAAIGDGIDAVRVLSMVTGDGWDLAEDVPTPHVTLSTRAGTAPERARSLDFTSAGAPDDASVLKLIGIVGVVVAERPPDPLSCLPARIAKRVKAFAANAQPGESLRFQPRDLSASDRAVLHEFGEDNNLESRSEGDAKTRRLTLVKKRPQARSHSGVLHHNVTDPLSSCEAHGGAATGRIVSHSRDLDAEDKKGRRGSTQGPSRATHRITDASRLEAALAAASVDSVPPSAPELAGAVGEGGRLVWPGGTAPWHGPGVGVVILRGLPGSGKTSVGRALAGSDGVICSADAFFEHGGGGRRRGKTPSGVGSRQEAYRQAFDPALLPTAHDTCLAQYMAALERRPTGLIVVDNTNSQRKEYEPYVRAARGLGIGVAVVELLCTSGTQAAAFCKRSVHGVPLSACLRMNSRWEHDPSCLLVRPMVATDDQRQLLAPAGRDPAPPSPDVGGGSLRRWMAEHHVAHFQRARRATHLQMAVGGKPVAFVDIPERRMDEFLHVYASSGMEDGNDYEPKYLAELVGEGAFRMYFDVDYVSGALHPQQPRSLAPACPPPGPRLAHAPALALHRLVLFSLSVNASSTLLSPLYRAVAVACYIACGVLYEWSLTALAAMFLCSLAPTRGSFRRECRPCRKRSGTRLAERCRRALGVGGSSSRDTHLSLPQRASWSRPASTSSAQTPLSARRTTRCPSAERLSGGWRRYSRAPRGTRLWTRLCTRAARVCACLAHARSPGVLITGGCTASSAC